jgi:hypothetical protein
MRPIFSTGPPRELHLPAPARIAATNIFVSHINMAISPWPRRHVDAPIYRDPRKRCEWPRSNIDVRTTVNESACRMHIHRRSHSHSHNDSRVCFRRGREHHGHSQSTHQKQISFPHSAPPSYIHSNTTGIRKFCLQALFQTVSNRSPVKNCQVAQRNMYGFYLDL